MKTIWFKWCGWGYGHLFGCLALAAAVSFDALAFRAVDRTSHLASATLYRFYPFAAPTFLGLAWLVAHTSDEGKG